MKLSFTKYRLNTIHPFAISRSTNDYYDRVFIFLEQDGLIGRGEAAPTERYSESVPQILERLSINLSLPNKVINIDEIINIFDNSFGDIKSLRSACVNAAFDWISQKHEKPLYDYFGIDNKISHPTSFTIAIGELDNLEEKIIEAKDYKIIKVKLGIDQDKEIIRTIRKFTNQLIRVDANEGWDLDRAKNMCEWLSSQKNIELIEQPLPASELDKMYELKMTSNLPLIADESCHSASNIEELVDKFDGINVKLTKCGGLDEALKMIDIAKDNQLKVMLGCMVESSIGITTLGQIASRVDYLDLDGNLLINNDPYQGLTIENGTPILPKINGIGVTLKPNYQMKYPDLK